MNSLLISIRDAIRGYSDRDMEMYLESRERRFVTNHIKKNGMPPMYLFREKTGIRRDN